MVFLVDHQGTGGSSGGTLPRAPLGAMQPPEGNLFYLEGEFLEIDTPERLSYTFRWEDPDPEDRETVVSLALRDLGDSSTELVFTQGDFTTERRRALHEEGWTQSLNKLAELVSPPET